MLNSDPRDFPLISREITGLNVVSFACARQHNALCSLLSFGTKGTRLSLRGRFRSLPPTAVTAMGKREQRLDLSAFNGHGLHGSPLRHAASSSRITRSALACTSATMVSSGTAMNMARCPGLISAESAIPPSTS